MKPIFKVGQKVAYIYVNERETFKSSSKWTIVYTTITQVIAWYCLIWDGFDYYTTEGEVFDTQTLREPTAEELLTYFI